MKQQPRNNQRDKKQSMTKHTYTFTRGIKLTDKIKLWDNYNFFYNMNFSHNYEDNPIYVLSQN